MLFRRVAAASSYPVRDIILFFVVISCFQIIISLQAASIIRISIFTG